MARNLLADRRKSARMMERWGATPDTANSMPPSVEQPQHSLPSTEVISFIFDCNRFLPDIHSTQVPMSLCFAPLQPGPFHKSPDTRRPPGVRQRDFPPFAHPPGTHGSVVGHPGYHWLVAVSFCRLDSFRRDSPKFGRGLSSNGSPAEASPRGHDPAVSTSEPDVQRPQRGKIPQITRTDGRSGCVLRELVI